MKEERLIIISGVTGDLGKAYYNHYSKDPSVKCVGITRQEFDIRYNWRKADLLNKIQTASAINSIPLEGIKEIILIHPVGKFKFEDSKHHIIDKNQDGIDDEVYNSNIKTFMNVIEPLCKRLENRKLTVCQFGSISDKYMIPYWKSYSKTKDKLRLIVKKLTDHNNIRGIFFDLSSTDTINESKTRPNANKKYWIKPKEVVEQSIPYINNEKKFQEISIYKKSPLYHNQWFIDIEALHYRWKKDMGNKHKKVKQNEISKN